MNIFGNKCEIFAIVFFPTYVIFKGLLKNFTIVSFKKKFFIDTFMGFQEKTEICHVSLYFPILDFLYTLVGFHSTEIKEVAQR